MKYNNGDSDMNLIKKNCLAKENRGALLIL